MDLIVSPADCKAVIALSRPPPGPLTRTSNSLTPNFEAFSAHCWAAHCPANGVLLRLPLKPHVPPLAQQRASPFVSVIVTVVLLKLALIWAMPTVTLRRALRRLLLATAIPYFMHFTRWNIRHSSFTYFMSLTPFFPATVFFGPLRVRALVRVR